MMSTLADAILRGESICAEPWKVAEAVSVLVERARTAPGLTAEQVATACGTLNKYRNYEACRNLASGWTALGNTDPTVRRHLAQAQINLGMLDAADALLRELVDELTPSEQAPVEGLELSEARGLQGRVAKQRFVASRQHKALETAFWSYYDGYCEDKGRRAWLGVNAVALLARAEAERLAFRTVDLKELVEELESQVRPVASQCFWNLAIMSELSLAANRCDEAEFWLYRFMHAPGCTPFALESYERQLREIWGARPFDDAERCQDRLARILARQLVQKFSTLSVTALDAEDIRKSQQLERVFSQQGAFSVDTIHTLLKACKSVGCISSRTTGARMGTGFLVQRSAPPPGEPSVLFVTNAHVLSEEVSGALPRDDALVSFELGPRDGDGKLVYYPIKRVIYTSPPGELGMPGPLSENLDVTIAELEGLPVEAKGLGVATALPLINGRSKAYVVGHPSGAALQIALHDSTLLAYDEVRRLLHYRTPTEPGSSGSPVFNENWRVIALHHGGSDVMPCFHPETGNYQANEGITFKAIAEGFGPL
ncbi:serine protease [Massilia sp. IC2-477]|uniref:serine protease n=1 Tax=Massilia sp. IC2-477 TaxID=2887198 RepID=UPI001D11348F|nr:serine protease [Massilia sp. IC2-477]MCC2955901.1 serine protease [Massilia sp. IC2-477]